MAKTNYSYAKYLKEQEKKKKKQEKREQKIEKKKQTSDSICPQNAHQTPDTEPTKS